MKKYLILLLLFVLFGIMILTQTACAAKDHNHSFQEPVKENEIPVSCLSDGSYDLVYYCATCGEEISRTPKTVEMLPHSPGAAVTKNKIEPTCNKKGSYVECTYCTVCGEKTSEQTVNTTRMPHIYEDGKCKNCSAPPPSEGLEYKKNSDGTYTVVGIGSCTDTSIVVPGELFGGDVVSISDGAFQKCDNITSLWIHDGLTYIGVAAFINCSSLETIRFPKSLKNIDNVAFLSCTSLTEIRLPDGIETVGSSAFGECPISVAYSPASAVMHLPKSTLRVLTVTSGEVIDKSFSGLTYLEDLTLPDTLVSIGDSAFENHISLKSVTIPAGVTKIGEFVFSNCIKLKSINVSEENTHFRSIDGNLYTKDGTCLINYAPGKTDESFIIPDGVSCIQDFAFYGCKGVKNLTIPKTVTVISIGAFLNLRTLSNVYYEGNEEEWEYVAIDSGNDLITDAKLYFNIELSSSRPKHS